MYRILTNCKTATSVMPLNQVIIDYKKDQGTILPIAILPTSRKMENIRVLFLMITLFFFSCGKEKSINAKVYKRGKIIGNYEGTFYATK